MPQNTLNGLTSQNRGAYFESANAGRAFSGGNQAAVATAFTAGLPTTYTGGLVLANPTNSTINVSINTASIAVLTNPTTTSTLGLAVAHSASALSGTLTAITPVCSKVGSSAAPQAKLYSSASVTLPVAPVLVKNLVTVAKGGTTTAENVYPIGGQIVLEPGSYCVVVSSGTGVASAFLGSFGWEEIPVAAQQ